LLKESSNPTGDRCENKDSSHLGEITLKHFGSLLGAVMRASDKKDAGLP
jgi:hypothetical protein